MGKVGWVIVGAAGGILFGKFLFSLPQSRVLVAKVQDKLDPIEVPEFDEELGDVAVYDPVELTAPKVTQRTAIVPTATATATRTTATTSPITTTTRTRLALR